MAGLYAEESGVSAARLAQASQCIATAIDAAGDDAAFYGAITAILEHFAPSDETMFIHFAEKPEIVQVSRIFRSFPEDEEMYVAGAYLLDPFFRAGRAEGFEGFATFDQLAPEGFRQSAYFETYLKKTGFVAECGYIVQFPDDSFINYSLDRRSGLGPFRDEELALLDSLTPVLKSASLLHWKANHEQRQDEGGTELNRQLDQGLENFASSFLTPREQEIICLVLQGHSSISIGERLDISPRTVRVHRNNSYKKLDVSSQSELFHLFIESMKIYNGEPGRDPLADYC